MERRMQRRMIRKSRVIREKIFLLLTAFLIFCLGTLALGGESGERNETYYESVKIQKGDTLWELAEEYKNEKETTEQMIRKIMEFNDMGSANIMSGAHIIIPITVLQ